VKKMKKYEIRCQGGSATIEAEDMAAAIRAAEKWLETGDWDRSRTLWLEARLREAPPYGESQMAAMDKVLDQFAAAFPCWSVSDLAEGNLDMPEGDAPAAQSVAAACSLHALYKHMKAANRAVADSTRIVCATLKPEPPPCVDGGGHKWGSPCEIVGGARDNPGVWNHGGGVIIKEVCLRCGCGKTTDTFAENPNGHERGLRSVSYQAGEYLDDLRAGPIAFVDRELPTRERFSV
jgi:hypothetical protein